MIRTWLACILLTMFVLPAFGKEVKLLCLVKMADGRDDRREFRFDPDERTFEGEKNGTTLKSGQRVKFEDDVMGYLTDREFRFNSEIIYRQDGTYKDLEWFQESGGSWRTKVVASGTCKPRTQNAF